MRRLPAFVLLLSLVGCGSQVRPQAEPTPSPSASPSETPAVEESSSAALATEASATSSPSPAATSSAAASAAPLSSASASPGQRYAVTALVVHLKDKPDQLCAPVTPMACSFGISTKGIDFAHLADRVEKDGAVQGRASLVVTLDKGVLHVVSQSVPPAAVADPGFRTPPCTAPKGGWPKGKDNEDLDQKPIEDYRQKHPDVMVAVAMLRPSKNQVVEYVLTNGDPTQVDKDLRPSYGARFCAFTSTWTRKQADQADLDRAFRYGHDRGVYLRDSSGLSMTGQLEVHVGAVLMTPALAGAVKKAPAGLVRLDLLLTPVTG